MICSSDLKIVENSRPSASNFKSFSRSLEQLFLTVGQNNFGNKIPVMFATHFFTNSKFRNICCSKKFIISEHPSVAMNEIDDSLLFQFPDKNQVIQNSSSKTIYDFSSVILFMSLSYTLII